MFIVLSMHTTESVHPTQGDYKDAQLHMQGKTFTYAILI